MNDNQEENSKIAEKIFGSTISKIKATGGRKIDFKKLLAPLDWNQAVVLAFCEDCGSYVELNQEIAERYAYSAGIKIPENPKSFYFRTKGCALCDSQNAEVKLIPLPNA
jgi:hypothetical protein